MKSLERANQWLERSKSNMARTRAGRVSPNILYEDLCYDAQQTVEKALKSVCILHEILFPKTHDIAYLIELLEKAKVEVPKDLQVAKILTGMLLKRVIRETMNRLMKTTIQMQCKLLKKSCNGLK